MTSTVVPIFENKAAPSDVVGADALPAQLNLGQLVCQIGIEHTEMPDLLDALRKELESQLGVCAVRISVARADTDTEVNPIAESYGTWLNAHRQSALTAQDPVLEAIASQQVMVVSDILAQAADISHTLNALMARWHAYTIVPFQVGNLRGAVAVYRRDASNEFVNDVNVVQSLIAPLSLAVFASSKKVSTSAADDTLTVLAKSIPGVVYQRRVAPDGDIRYTYISDSAREFFGVEPELILSDPKALFKHYDPDYRDGFREKLLEASRNLSIWDVEASIRLPQGGIRYTHAMARPVRKPDGSVLWTGVILDASRIKEAEHAAASAEARTRSNIVESLSQAFLLFDPSDHLVIANSHFYALYPELSGRVIPGCTYTQYAHIEHELLTIEATETRGGVPSVEERMLQRNQGRVITERRRDSDRWLMVSEHRTGDGSTVVLYADVSELKQRERRIHHLAYHDSLTGLSNRAAFRQTMDEVVRRANREDRTIAVMCLDIDRFKFVNDTLGHPAGDELLMQVANRLSSVIREGETAARLGGDEFAIVLDLASPGYVSDLALRILSAIGKPFHIAGHNVTVTTSIGIALVEGSRIHNVDVILKNADLALYQAKTDGRNTYCFFEEKMDAAAQERRQLEMDLRTALENEELLVYYQPLVDSTSGAIVGMEALLRWDHPIRGLVQPDDFIPVAEESGLIPKIGEWVLKRACFDAAAWPTAIRVAVNLSPSQFRNPHFADIVRENLLASRLDPRRLELEVTESLLLRDTVANLNVLTEIKRLGVRIAMDDFGTGYSSLANLRSFPFDKIKIDRGFVKDLNGNADSAAIVKAVLGLAHGLGMATTAEGVETTDQLNYLRAEGCGEVQGFLFSKPRPSEDVISLLAINASEMKAKAKLAKAAADAEKV